MTLLDRIGIERNWNLFKTSSVPRIWPRFRVGTRVRKIQSQLPVLTCELEAACKDAEPEFMGLGQKLQGIYGDARELTRQVVESVNLLGGGDQQGVLFHLRGLAESSIVQLRNCQRDVSEKTAAIQSIADHLSGLRDVCHELEKVGLLLRIVAVNIGIESARSLSSGDLFSVVAQDTGNLSDKIRGTIGEGLSVLTKALSAQEQLHHEFSNGVQEIDRLGGNAQNIVQEAAHGIEALMNRTREFVNQAGENSRQIQQQVGDLVVAIQFHDSMSQRVAHISEALCDVARYLSDTASNSERRNYGDHLANALSILMIQSAQLREIIHEVEEIHEKCLHSFQEILTGFTTLVAHLSEISATREGMSKKEMPGDDPFKRLERSFGELNRVLHGGRSLMKGVDRAAVQVSGTVDYVTKCVHEMHGIGFENHLIALNAIIKAAHLDGDGGAIEVLAREMNQSSIQSRSVLGRAVHMLQGIVSDSDHLRQNHSDNASSEAPFDEAVVKISQAYHRFMHTTRMAQTQADRIAAVIQQTTVRLRFLPLLSEKFSEYLAQIEAMIRELRPCIGREHAAWQMESGGILNRYTMERERKIHEKSLYGAKMAHDSDGMAPSPASPVMRGMKEIEEGRTAALAAGIELFSEETPSEKDDEEFEDNVELF